ncbi:hypothetical protein ACIO3R_19395 [Streptomyces sp. NPDC087428]|uniref:hypothetical protein n=1 Tax=Streptomyces sp. NPDC087428 TaxID=3365788 RepID=UPI00381EF0FD
MGVVVVQHVPDEGPGAVATAPGHEDPLARPDPEPAPRGAGRRLVEHGDAASRFLALADLHRP